MTVIGGFLWRAFVSWSLGEPQIFVRDLVAGLWYLLVSVLFVVVARAARVNPHPVAVILLLPYLALCLSIGGLWVVFVAIERWYLFVPAGVLTWFVLPSFRVDPRNPAPAE